MATKADIISELQSKYKAVSALTLIENYSFLDGNSTKWYQAEVLEVGTSESSKPLGHKRTINFYVYNEGDASEEAYYTKNEPDERLKKSTITATGTLSDLSRIYFSTELRERVRIQIYKSAQAINWEDVGTSNHAERLKWAIDALTGQKSYLDAFMGFVALDATIQTNGVDSTDSQIETVVNSWIDFLAVNIFGA